MRHFFIFLLILICAVVCSAEAKTIILKDGNVIVGDIVKETESYVVISRNKGSFVFTITKDRISSIRESNESEKKTEEALNNPKNTAKPAEMPVINPESADAAQAAPQPNDRKTKLDQYRKERYEKEVELAKQARGRIKIPFANGVNGVVEATLNGKVKVLLYVDTGASLVVISRSVADKLALSEDDIKGNLSVVLANGSTDVATAIVLKSVKVGSSSAKNVEAAITENPPGGGVDGLLGMTFLKHFHVKLDSNENCLILEKY